MTVSWRAVVLCCCVLLCVGASAPSPHLQRNKYHSSFRLTRSTRTRVQQLLSRYKEQQLGNKNFEDRHRKLKGLPSLSTDFYRWLSLTDSERLHTALRDVQAYWDKLEWKRKQVEKEVQAASTITTTLPQNIRHIQLDLQDLMSQVRGQMSYTSQSEVERTTAARQTPPNPGGTSKTMWDSRVEGYIILRDLDLYLTKLARDFLILASKTKA